MVACVTAGTIWGRTSTTGTPKGPRVARSTCGSVHSPLALKVEMEVFPLSPLMLSPFATSLSAVVLPLPSHETRRRRETGPANSLDRS